VNVISNVIKDNAAREMRGLSASTQLALGEFDARIVGVILFAVDDVTSELVLGLRQDPVAEQVVHVHYLELDNTCYQTWSNYEGL